MAVAASGDFELTQDELRLVARFGAEAAQEVLPLFERSCPDDPRSRTALDGAWEFIDGARRTNRLRVTLMDAHRAAKEAPDEVARLAAQGAGDAAAAGYLRPIARAHQVAHILRAPANAARIAELEAGGNADVGSEMIQRMRQRATPALIDVLRRYPPAPPGKNRAANLMAELDTGLRS